MPVYRKNKLVHIHIPRTGGTAIEIMFHALGDMVWGLDSWVGEDQCGDRWYEFQHLTYRELLQMAGPEIGSDVSFAVVRDPRDRLVSDYRWREYIGRTYPDAPVLSFPSFERFVRAIPPDIDANWDELIRGASRSEANFLIHVRPQHHYLEARGEQIAVEHLLRFEQFKEDVTGLMERFGIGADSIRRPTGRDRAEFFTAETLEIVNRLYHRDLELLGYPET